MGSRLDLHDKFIDILGTKDEQESRVYFNPPESVKMKYECIRYALAAPDVKRANNGAYYATPLYDGVVISKNHDTNTPNLILAQFPMCYLGNPYVADNLYHFPFRLYY